MKKAKKYSKQWRDRVLSRTNPQPIFYEKAETRRITAYAATLKVEEKKEPR